MRCAAECVTSAGMLTRLCMRVQSYVQRDAYTASAYYLPPTHPQHTSTNADRESPTHSNLIARAARGGA